MWNFVFQSLQNYQTDGTDTYLIWISLCFFPWNKETVEHIGKDAGDRYYKHKPAMKLAHPIFSNINIFNYRNLYVHTILDKSVSFLIKYLNIY